MSTAKQDSTPRRNRYSRSSTTSVTQLLSDSCSSLLQKLTTRVRGPSSTVEHTDPVTTRKTPVLSRYGSTKSRFEDKYTAILDRYTSYRKRDEDNPRRHERDKSYLHHKRGESPYIREEKTLEPSVQRTIVKSPTKNVLLSEKAYPYVSTSNIGREVRREKTPGYHRIDRHLINSEDYKRYGRHKSGHADSRRIKVRPPNRSGKSEQIEGTSLGLRSGEAVNCRRLEFNRKELNDRDVDRTDPEKTPTDNGVEVEEETDPVLREREVRRKEIQSLIMKYAALDEAYGKFTNDSEIQKQSTTDKIASKYQKNNVVKNETKVAKACNTDVESVRNAIVSCRTRAKFADRAVCPAA